MSFDDLQAAWQSQQRDPRVVIDADLLLKEVQRSQRQLDSALFRRDATEIIVAAFLTCVFLYGGIRRGDWAQCVAAVACFGVGAFLLVDRWIQHRRRPAADAPLQICIRASLLQVNHQIWLLRNIFWWYLLPIAIGWGAIMVSVSWKARGAGIQGNIGLLVYLLFCGFLGWGIYWLNQKAVKAHLAPRRKELETLLESLKQ